MKTATKLAVLLASSLVAPLLTTGSSAIAQTQQNVLRTYSNLPSNLKSLVPSGGPRTSAEIQASPFGTHTTVINEGGDPAIVSKLPDLISAAGYKWVEDYAAVGALDGLSPTTAASRWNRQRSRAIEYVKRLHDLGISVLIRIDPLPWRQLKNSPPSDEQIAGGAQFASLVVKDLKPWVRDWQIWNEPNIGNENPVVPAPLYVQIAASVSKAIRAEQANAVIYGPGTAMLQSLAAKPLPWIDQALDAGLMKYIDVFSYHPYHQPYLRTNIPEHASEFYPWKRWGTYEAQIKDLRTRINAAAKRNVPIAATEDGIPTFTNADGEQQIPPIVAAKYELRRNLLDAWLGVNPRIQFVFYRQASNQDYESEASFNTLTSNGDLRPLYYAVQNLYGILDGSHHPQPDIRTTWDLTGEKSPPTIRTQVWKKSMPGGEEVLIAYWAEAEADTLHRRWRGTLKIQIPGFEAPRIFDLMAMPAPKMKGELAQLVNPEYKPRKPSTEPFGYISDTSWITIPQLEIRDYPQILQLVKLSNKGVK
ncbi:hypothetical protein [Zoogloea sp. LCSB751]|uniref:hypothetical protein n=1 Tax=Zoogloea sp. LCSB751 TaxID=1965277 RepID=UPI001115C037|nr:hypothetical protein [Zoogloea sp. LCSB751]